MSDKDVIELLKKAQRFLAEADQHPPEQVAEVCEIVGEMYASVAHKIHRAPWIDFREQPPADGQQVEWCWNYQGWQPGDYWQYAVSPGGPNGASWLIFWRPWRFEPPSAEMIERAQGTIIYDVKVIECVYDGSYIEHIIESPIDCDRNEIVGVLVRIGGAVYQITRCNMSAIVHHRRGERIGVRLEEVKS